MKRVVDIPKANLECRKRSLIRTTILIVVTVPAFPEERPSLRILYWNGLLRMVRQRVADNQITMVQSQKVQHFLARILRFSGIHKVSALVNRKQFIYSEFLFRELICELICNLTLSMVLVPHKIPPLETKWWQICKLEWFLQMILIPWLGFVKVLTVCISSWFLIGPEICLAA